MTPAIFIRGSFGVFSSNKQIKYTEWITVLNNDILPKFLFEYTVKCHVQLVLILLVFVWTVHNPSKQEIRVELSELGINKSNID